MPMMPVPSGMSTPLGTSAMHLSPIMAVALEFKKMRHKHLVALSAVLLAFQLLWIAVIASQTVKQTNEFIAVFFQMPMMNAIFLPLLSAVVASTACDVENRGNMYKELLTMQRPRTLFSAKWVCVAIILGVFVSLQTTSVVLFSSSRGFVNLPGPAFLALYGVSTFAVCLLVATVIQVLSLFSPSQFLPLATGVGLSFLGLFSMFLPQAVSRLVPSAYFGLLGMVDMAFDSVTGSSTFSTRPWSIGDFIIVVAATAVIYILAGRAFSRREL